MADFTIANSLQGAQNHVQSGLDVELIFIKQSEVASITFASTGEVATLVMTTGKEGYIIQANVDEASLDSNITGTGSYGQTVLTFDLHGLTSATKKTLDSLDNSTGVMVLVPLANGLRRLCGIEFDTSEKNTTDAYFFKSKTNAGTDTTGTINDGASSPTNKMQRVYTWSTRYTAPFVDVTLDLAVLTAPAS